MAAISTALGKAGVNIDSISSESFGEGAVTRIVTKDARSAKEALERAGLKVSEDNLLIVAMLDRPGELGKVATLLAQAKVNIESIFVLSKKNNETVIAFHVDRENAARDALASYLRDNY
jgi:hypothetical protein